MGPYVAYAVGGSIKQESLTNGTTTKEDIKWDLLKNFRGRWDYGISSAIGLDYKNFRIEIGYQFGIKELTHLKLYRTQVASLSLGYNFFCKSLMKEK